jgi:hypothetical protein
MANDSLLVEKVNQRLTAENNSHENLIFKPALLKAMKLADLYVAVEPLEYILPLDEMVGLPVAAKSQQKFL